MKPANTPDQQKYDRYNRILNRLIVAILIIYILSILPSMVKIIKKHTIRITNAHSTLTDIGVEKAGRPFELFFS